MSAPYRDPEQPPACERCAARDKRIADARRIAGNVAYGAALACVLVLMVAHTTIVCVVGCIANDGVFPVVLPLSTQIVVTLMFNKSLPDNARRLALAAWAIVVSLAWAVFVGRLT